MGVQGEFFETPEIHVPVTVEETSIGAVEAIAAPRTRSRSQNRTKAQPSSDASASESSREELTETTLSVESPFEETAITAQSDDTTAAEEATSDSVSEARTIEFSPESVASAMAAFEAGVAADVPLRVETTQRSSAPTPRRSFKDLTIPKLYYSISEVSRLTGLEQYVLRYWETEFEELKPQKNRAGNRIYSNRDIKFILRIKELLREQRYTIEGAKHILRSEHGQKMTAEEAPPLVIQDPAQIALPTEPATPVIPTASITAQEIDALRAELISLRSLLRK